MLELNMHRCSNPVRAAYITSLESQISSLRDELATVYKTQGQNAQRLLAMNETLREKEELSRMDAENLRKCRDEIAILRKKVEQHNELMAEKDRTAQVRYRIVRLPRYTDSNPSQILHDEINTLQLELSQIEDRNQTLVKDNAKLLQRWLDAKQAEANRMNEANQFYEEMQSRKAAQNQDKADASSLNSSVSGNGEERQETGSTMTNHGTPSHAETDVNLTPNG